VDKILVLSNDDVVSNLLEEVFLREYFCPILAKRQETPIQDLLKLEPDVLIVDSPFAPIALVELCSQIKMLKCKTPIIVLGNSNEEKDKVSALEGGADDYVVKPFAVRELVARVRALLRRQRTNLDRVIRFGNVEIDPQRRSVSCRGEEVNVTLCEYKLLMFFLANVDLALTRNTLLGAVWGYTEEANTRTLDTHVNRLRKKCESNPNRPLHFLTIHGVGYRFRR
jgi:DNA-binding response OmpR family regulator